VSCNETNFDQWVGAGCGVVEWGRVVLSGLGKWEGGGIVAH